MQTTVFANHRRSDVRDPLMMMASRLGPRWRRGDGEFLRLGKCGRQLALEMREPCVSGNFRQTAAMSTLFIGSIQCANLKNGWFISNHLLHKYKGWMLNLVELVRGCCFFFLRRCLIKTRRVIVWKKKKETSETSHIRSKWWQIASINVWLFCLIYNINLLLDKTDYWCILCVLMLMWIVGCNTSIFVFHRFWGIY